MEMDHIVAFGPTLRGHCDGLYRVFEHTQHTLALFLLVEFDGRDSAHAFRQIVGIGSHCGVETVQRLTVHVYHRQFGVTGCSHREMDHIHTTGTALGTHRDTVFAVDTAAAGVDGLQGCVLCLIHHFRQFGRTLRQVHPILVLLGVETYLFTFGVLQGKTLDAQAFEGIHRICCYRERDLIDRRTAVVCGHDDTHGAIHRTFADNHGLELIALHHFDRRQLGRTYRQRVGVGLDISGETLQGLTTDEDGRQGRDTRSLGSEDDLIYQLVSVAGCDGDTRRTVDTAVGLGHRLILVTGHPGDSRHFGRTHRQVDIVGRVLGVEIGDITAFHLQVLQIHIRRGFHLEIQLIGLRHLVTGRGHADLIRTAVYGARRGIDDGLRTFGIGRHRFHHRHRRRTHRYRHTIYRLRRVESRHRRTVHQDVLQRVIGQLSHTEIQGIGGFGTSVSRRHSEYRLITQRLGLGDTHGLFVLLFLGYDHRSRRRSVGQIYGIIVFARTETGNTRRVATIHIRDTRQLGIAAGGFLELYLIRRRALAVFGFHSDRRGFAHEVTVGDTDLTARQLTTVEVHRRTTGVGERTGTTIGFDLGDRRSTLTQGVGLHVLAIRVKPLPFLAAYIQTLYLRRIDQLQIIHIQRVTGIQTAVGTEVRIVGRREDDIQARRGHVVHVVDRHTDVRPLVVQGTLTPHTFAHLRSFHRRTALIAVQRLTHIRLLVVIRHRRTVLILAFVLVTARLTRPCVVQKVKVLLGVVVTRTTDPYTHRVRTVGEVDTAIRTGSSLTNGGDTGHIRPRLTQGKITRAGLGDTHRTYVLVLHHHTVAAVMTGFFVGEVELQPHLLHIRGVPAFRLRVTVKSGTAPVFKIRVGNLLCLHSRATQQKKNPQQGCFFKQTS